MGLLCGLLGSKYGLAKASVALTEAQDSVEEAEVTLREIAARGEEKA